MPVRMEEAQLAGSCICFVIELKGLTHSPPLCFPPPRADGEHSISQIGGRLRARLPAPGPPRPHTPVPPRQHARRCRWGQPPPHAALTGSGSIRDESTERGACPALTYPVRPAPSGAPRLGHAAHTPSPPPPAQRTCVFLIFKEIKKVFLNTPLTGPERCKGVMTLLASTQ